MLLCAALIGLSVPTPLWARIVPVSTYAQLVAACQSAQPGDTIVLAAGTYTISGASRIMITNRPGPVLLRGASGNPDDVIIEGQGQDNSAVQMVFNLDNCPDWTFRDLTTRRSYYHGFKFDRASTNCRLIRVVMRDHGESGVKGTSDPAAAVYPDGLLIDSCDIGFTSTNGGTRSVVEGVDGVGVNDWIIRNSRFVNVQKGGAPAYAIFTKGNSSNTIIEGNRFENCFIGASFGGGGTGAQYFRDNDQTYEHRNGIIRNNIIMRCTDAGVYINKGMNCRVYNNTLFECELTIQLRFVQSTGYVSNNLVKRSVSNPSEPVVRLRDGATFLANQANLAATNADFVAATGTYSQLNLRLANTSPAIDAGVDLGSDVPVDFEGQPRPAGSSYDVGADELGMVPVELLSLHGGWSGAYVYLAWRTASERNGVGFLLETSREGSRFVTAASVPSRSRAGEGADYSVLLPVVNLPEATAFFRLRHIDADGRQQVLGTLHLGRFTSEHAVPLEIYPNPAGDAVFVRHSSTAGSEVRIVDAAGRLMFTTQVSSGSGVTRLDLRGLVPGVYWICVGEEEGTRALMLRR